MIKKIFSIFACLSILVCCFTACAKQETKENQKPIVYASFFPIYDMVRQIAGDTLDVRPFMPINTDPHMWKPTAKDMKELSKADILFVNGANMEHWVEQVKENLPDLKIVNLSEKLELISYKGASDLGDFQYMAKLDVKKGEQYKFSFGHTHEDVMRVCFVRNEENLPFEKLVDKTKKNMQEKGKLIPQKDTIHVEENKVYSLEMGHESGTIYFDFDTDGEWYVASDRISERLLSYNIMKGNENLDVEDVLTHSTSNKDKITYDPHSWLSLKNAKIYLNTIYDVLVEKYDNKNLYKKNRFNAVNTLTSMHAKYKDKFNKLDTKEFITTHYAWEYLAQEFSLIQYPLQGLISTESPSLKTIKKAIDYCKLKKINTIFYEAHMPPKNADTLAEEIDGKVMQLNSMEYVKESEDVGAYTRIMEENLENIYKSMVR